jgi:nucleoside 2-deoxyribosyltransferase
MAIFSLDVFEIIDSDGLALNLNGRVPDEGAMVEAGIAWANNKSLVIFKNDDRSLIQGNCNPLVMGLSNFEFVENYKDIPIAFAEKFKRASNDADSSVFPKFETAKKNGRAIREYLSSKKTLDEITELLILLFGEIICQRISNQKENSILARMQQ